MKIWREIAPILACVGMSAAFALLMFMAVSVAFAYESPKVMALPPQNCLFGSVRTFPHGKVQCFEAPG